MIKNIIFDIGDVLMYFTWDEYMHSLFNGNQEKIDAINEAIEHTDLWVELDKNVIPTEELFNRLINYNKTYRNDVVCALKKAKGCFNRTDFAIPWIDYLKAQGYKIYFLSNYSHFNMATCPEVLDFLPHTDGGIFSCDVQLIKPDIAIYEKLCHEYELIPEECIFIDDRKENVEAAINFGMKAIQFTSYEETNKLLQEMLNK